MNEREQYADRIPWKQQQQQSNARVQKNQLKKQTNKHTICKRVFLWLCLDGRPGVNFINILRAAFTLVDPKSVKNTVKSSVSFYAFGIYVRKSCT